MATVVIKKNPLLKDITFLLLFAMPLAAMLAWSIEPSIRTLLGSSKMPPVQKQLLDNNDPIKIREFKRSLQMYFLDYNVYIPLEDIVILDNDPNNRMFNDMMQKVCGAGSLYIWLPLPIRLPIIHNKTFEHCWKPKIANN